MRIFFVDSLHVLLGTWVGGAHERLVPGSFLELQGLFARAFVLLREIMPDVFAAPVEAKFMKWMWAFSRGCQLPQPAHAATFRDKVWGQMLLSFSALTQLCFSDASRQSPLSTAAGGPYR